MAFQRENPFAGTLSSRGENGELMNDKADKKPKAAKPEAGGSGTVPTIDYRRSVIPPHVVEIIETHLAIEQEDARRAGTLGFMTRSLAIATMPHKNPNTDIFERRNGDFRLRMLAGSSLGLPYGSLPRLLVAWVCTEAAQTKSPTLVLGDSLAQFLRELDLARGGGPRGNVTRVRDQMRRLFGTFISAEYMPTGPDTNERRRRGFAIKNIQLVEEAREDVWWNPDNPHKAGTWQTTVQLSQKFYQECIDGPIPIDQRAYKKLRASPLALDIYTWLTYRMSYLSAKSRPIRWEALQAQFGSNYTTDDQGLRNFRKAFLRELKRVRDIYSDARVEQVDKGLVLLPSPPHVTPDAAQRSLF